jgi:hypothetical protein
MVMKLCLTGFVFLCCAFTAQAENDCATASVRWAEDPLVLQGEEIIPILRPGMIRINEAGECFIDNSNGYEAGTPQIDWEGFAKIDFIDEGGKRSSHELLEAEALALSICNSVSV